MTIQNPIHIQRKYTGSVPMVSSISSNNLLLASAISVVGIVIVGGVVQRWASTPSDCTDEEDDNHHQSTTSLAIRNALPTHLKRLLYKEQRRKESVRHLAMKKPMYDNIEMYSPQGDLLCTISKKKAAWYIGKKLADWRIQGKSIQLAFTPKGQPSEKGNYHQSHKKNVCVVCGDSDKFMRHYVVPYCYRALFPKRYKTHLPHDIVILCPDCHIHCEKSTHQRQKQLDQSVRTIPGTDRPHIPNRTLHRVKSAALALYNRREQIPPEKIKEHETTIQKHFGLEDTTCITNAVLEAATSMETSIPNPKYIPGPELVVSCLANDEKSIERFILDWREHFVQTMQPRYLPTGWSVDSPVHI